MVILAVVSRGAVVESVDPKTLIDPELPAWIDAPLALPEAPVSPGSPVRYLIIEEQADVEMPATFCHYARRVDSEAGLQSAGQITLTWAKDYEQLRWHYLRVWREGQKRELLKPDVLQVLRQEEDADRFMYHGRLSVLAVLHDVRVGDIIEYAFTRIGANPVFGGKFSRQLSLEFSVPVDRLLYRVSAPATRPLHIASLGRRKLEPQEETKNGRIDYRWSASDVPEVRSHDDAPEWEVQYSIVQLSEFASWHEVATWGHALFPIPETLSAELAERLAEITKGQAGREAKANAVLRFVQDDIRYVALHFGESSHRPYPPEEVLRRRFGDCKDKALLLATFLRHLGYETSVALVNTSWGKRLNTLLPSPYAFDHAIVHVRCLPSLASPGLDTWTPTPAAASNRLIAVQPFDERLGGSRSGLDVRLFGGGGEDLWLDGTRSLQGGAFTEHYHSDFGYALRLASDVDRPQSVEPPTKPGSEMEVTERYDASVFDRPAQLEVSIAYRGAMADYYRYYRRYGDPSRSAQVLAGTLSRFFPKVRTLGATEWTDDREDNLLTSRARFEVPDFWVSSESGKIRNAEVYPWSMTDYLPRPEIAERDLAFGLSYPFTLSHTIEVGLPKNWPEGKARKEIADDTFQFQAEQETRADRLHLSYRWQTRTDSVAPSAMAGWLKKMAEVRGELGYHMRENLRLAAELDREGPIWPMVGGIVLGVALGIGIGGWFYRRASSRSVSSEPPVLDSGLVGLGGWLIIPAIGLVLRPLVSLRQLWPTFSMAFNWSTWVTMTDPESTKFVSGYAVAIMVEACVGAAMIVWSAIMIPQFFQRKASLPFTFITFLIVAIVWVTIDGVWVQLLGLGAGDDQLAKTLLGMIVPASIWIPYFLCSRRVKLTFVN